MYFRVSTVMHTGTRWIQRTLSLAGVSCEFHPPCEVQVGHLIEFDPGPFVPVRDPLRMMLSNWRDTGAEHWPRKAAALNKCLARLEGYPGRMLPIEAFDWAWVEDLVSERLGREVTLTPSVNQWKTPDEHTRAADERDLEWIGRYCADGLKWLRMQDWSRWLDAGDYEAWWDDGSKPVFTGPPTI